MKKLVFGFIIVALSLLFINADVYDQDWTVISDNKGGLTASITFPARTDSAGSVHSNALFIGGFNDNDAFIQATAATASDKNIIIHLSNDLRNWQSQTMAGLDAVTTTMLVDTLGDTGCPYWHSMSWMIVEDDGQAAATVDDIIYITINAKADQSNSRTVESGDNNTNP